jgi:exonuclease VII large subunit
MPLTDEVAERVAATPSSQSVLATPRRQNRQSHQMVRRFFRATMASQLRVPAKQLTAFFNCELKEDNYALRTL